MHQSLGLQRRREGTARSRLRSAEYVRGHTIRLRFDDGIEGAVDFADELWGEVFEPLRDPEVFRSFRLDRELKTLTWPSGADFAPEFLYERASAQRRAARGS